MCKRPKSPGKKQALTSGITPPRTWDELHAVVVANGGAFPRQLAELAAFALHHPDIMAFGSCPSIARRAGVSTTTVSRFARLLGYRAFRDLRRMFRDDLASQTSPGGVRAGIARPGSCSGPAV